MSIGVTINGLFWQCLVYNFSQWNYNPLNVPKHRRQAETKEHYEKTTNPQIQIFPSLYQVL